MPGRTIPLGARLSVDESHAKAAKEIVATVARTSNLSEACASLKIGHSTLERWRALYPETLGKPIAKIVEGRWLTRVRTGKASAP